MLLPHESVCPFSPGSMQPQGSSSYRGPLADYMGSKRPNFNMKQKLWTLAFVWALLIAGLNFSHGGTNRRGTWETQGEASISTQVNHPAAPQSPMYGSWKCFPRSPVDNPHFHQQYIHSAYSGFTPLQSYFSSLTLLITSYLINQGCVFRMYPQFCHASPFSSLCIYHLSFFVRWFVFYFITPILPMNVVCVSWSYTFYLFTYLS